MHSTRLQQLIRLALPTALQNMLVSVLGMSDVFMVTTLGAAAVAAIGISAKLHFVLIMIMAGLGTAISILVAQHHGRGNQKAAQGILSLGIGSGLVLLVPFALIFLFAPELLLGLLTQDKNLIQYASGYLRITIPLLFLTHVIICYESALRARSETVAPLVLASIAIVLNIALNYLLIYGTGPFPRLGVMGVAVASVIARTVQLLLFLGYLAHRRHPLRLINLYRTRQLMHPYVKSYRASALPLTVNFTLWGFGTFVYHGIASHVGTDALASLSLVSPIEGMYHALFFGFVTACSVLIGQNLGRNNFDEAMLLAKRFTLFAPLASVFVGLLLFLLKPVYLPLLLNPGDSLYQLSEQLLFVVCFTSWIKTLNMVLIIGILRAGGDNKYVLGTDMIAMWLLGIPASFVAAFVFELSYVWVYAMVLIEEIAKATLAFRRARKRIWLRNLTLDDDFSPESEAA